MAEKGAQRGQRAHSDVTAEHTWSPAVIDHNRSVGEAQFAWGQ
jgi:hypothetical protein